MASSPKRVRAAEIYHAACREAVAVAAHWKEKSGVKAKLLTRDEARRGATGRGNFRQAAEAIAPDVGHPPLDVLCSLWDAIDSARLAKRFDEPLYRPKRITARNLLLQTLAKLGGADCRG